MLNLLRDKYVAREIFKNFIGIVVVFMLPVTLVRLFRSLSPNGYGVNNASFVAFGDVDVFFRPWYAKIANDFKEYGRFGYSWDDSIGLALGPRIYNNLVTYWLLRKLGVRTMCAIAYLLFLMSVMYVLVIHYDLSAAVIFGLLICGSPLIVQSFTHFGKPEMFWGWLVILLVFFLLSDELVYSAILWSIISMVNFSGIVLVSLSLGAVFILKLIVNLDKLFPVVVFLLPGVVKILWRIHYMRRSGFLNKLAYAQSNLWRRNWFDFSREFLVCILYLVAIVSSGISNNEELLTVFFLAVAPIIIYYLNWRILYINDEQVFVFLLFVIAYVYSTISADNMALLFSFLLAYRYISFASFNVKKAEFKIMSNLERLQILFKYIINFPNFNIINRAAYKDDAVRKLLGKIKPKTRIILETDSNLRTDFSKRRFWEFYSDALNNNKVSLCNDMYLPMINAALATDYLDKFNSRDLTPSQIDTIVSRLGCQYVVTFTSEMTKCLTDELGYLLLGTIKVNNDMFDKIETVKYVHLLEYPVKNSIISPYVNHEYKSGDLVFNADADCEYKIKFAGEKFKCLISGVEVPVRYYNPFDDLDLKFAIVTAPVNGRCVVSLQSNKYYI